MARLLRVLREAMAERTRAEVPVHDNGLRRPELDRRFRGSVDAIMNARDPEVPR